MIMKRIQLGWPVWGKRPFLEETVLKGAHNEVGRKVGIQRTTHCLNVANVTTRPRCQPS